MKKSESNSRFLTWLMALMLGALLTACGGGGGGGGGGKDPILGSGGTPVLGPTVTTVAPGNNTAGVPISTKIITVAFSKAMDPATLTTTSFTLACGAAGTAGIVGTPKTAVTGGGAVTYLALGNVATLPLPAATNLPALADCTATVTTAAKDTTGVALNSNFVWTFTTGLAPDTTRPRVTLTVPATTIPGPTLGAVANAAITAVFSEDMAPASITTAGTFTVTCGPGNVAPCVAPAPVGGAATYVVGSRTATYTPTVALATSTTYTATITTAATDLALNALAGNQAALPAASNYVWTFTTAAAVVPPAPITVISTVPAAGVGGICPNATIKATFNNSVIRMDDPTVASNFTVTGPGATIVTPASVVLDVPTGRVATFTPLAALPVGLYTATVKGGPTGVKDLTVPTANTMASDFTWSFTVVPATGACLPPVNPGILATFAIASFGGVTNTGATKINGDVVLNPTAACNLVPILFADGPGFGLCGGNILNVPTKNAGDTVVTAIYPDALTAPPITAALNAKWNSISPANTPGATVLGCGTIGSLGSAGAGIGCSGNSTLPPGAYISSTGSSIDVAGVLTLDGGGNQNATWIFQAPSSTVITAVNSSINLTNGAKASNVWWYVGSSATINGGSAFQGNILASASISMGTLATSCGRLLAGAGGSGAFTFLSNTVSVPGNPNGPVGCQ